MGQYAAEHSYKRDNLAQSIRRNKLEGPDKISPGAHITQELNSALGKSKPRRPGITCQDATLGQGSPHVGLATDSSSPWLRASKLPPQQRASLKHSLQVARMRSEATSTSTTADREGALAKGR